jgi:hypothetical protein
MTNRKQRRTNKSNNKYYEETKAPELFGGAFKTVGIVVAIFIVFYVITVLVTGNKSLDKTTDDDNNVDASIQYKNILAGELFNMPVNEYYVLIYDSKANDAIIYSTVSDKYTGTIPLYIVDLNNGFNKPYIGSPSNVNAGSSLELKINGPTLIKIKAGKNILYKEGKESIKAEL